MANQIADAIRRIVGFDPTRDPLDPSGEKGQILGSTGVGYLYPDQSSIGKSNNGGESVGNNAPADDKIITPSTGLPASQTGGNRVDSKDPSQAVHSVQDGVYSASEVISPDSSKTITWKDTKKYESGLGGLTDAASGGGTLNGLTEIFDCNDGTAIDIRLDGYFVPPEGWEDAETPPEDTSSGWELGFTWSATADDAEFQDALPLNAATQAKNAGGGGAYTRLDDSTYTPGGPFIAARWTYIFRDPSDPDENNFYGITSIAVPCSPSEGDPLCPLENPAKLTKWPADGKMQLIRTPEGKLQISPFEPDEDISWNYTDGEHSTINFCFEGDRQGVLEPTNDGGYMIYEKVDGFGQGIYKIFGMNNRVIGYTDAVGAEAYRPLPPAPTEP